MATSRIQRGTLVGTSTSSQTTNAMPCPTRGSGNVAYSVPISTVNAVLTPEQRRNLQLSPGQCGVGLEALRQAMQYYGTPLTEQQYQALRSQAQVLPINRETPVRSSSAPSPPRISPAPAYTPTPEQLAWQQFYESQLKGVIEQKGIGFPEETKNALIQQQIALIRAQEQEALRNLRTQMERRGITNSLYALSQEQKLKSASTLAMSQAVTDVNIKDALQKISSYENALSRAASYLAYLAEESSKKYQPQYNTWVIQQEALLRRYQSELDTYKMQIDAMLRGRLMQQEYALRTQLARLEFEFRKQLAQMELEANSRIAAAEGFGTLLGLLFSFLF